MRPSGRDEVIAGETAELPKLVTREDRLRSLPDYIYSSGGSMHKEEIINKELLTAQGKRVDIGGYYKPDDKLASLAMRPSVTFNKALASF